MVAGTADQWCAARTPWAGVGFRSSRYRIHWRTTRWPS